ncbi:hypothetical protein [Candidatus Contubernalis alkaliaceticus]|uniref:hypothetical protein n=1 Tax=Candidatus Contubernalis alkaliaceticus TaxID=338645 RepID=UPI001F4BFE49|nr:hypothetical protein [Candidatus Contubernalis alkalaceticus]UNC91533.1 hypothetical protein HUE98_05185 [Candidatus Contubernalis alkalaceticus]
MKQKLFACFFLGVLLGLFLMQTMLGKEMNRLHYEKERWRIELYDTLEILKNHEERLKSQQFMVVNDVITNLYSVNNHIDSFTELELKKQIREIVKTLIGQEIDEINPKLVFKLLDERLIEVEEKNFLIKVRSVIMAEKVIFNLEAEYLPELQTD